VFTIAADSHKTKANALSASRHNAFFQIHIQGKTWTQKSISNAFKANEKTRKREQWISSDCRFISTKLALNIVQRGRGEERNEWCSLRIKARNTIDQKQ
jgi:hypothetical protein